ncbi:hypothetical protein BDP27DRAFT_1431459 [Rhodocollybia butyracea]|uniref:Uncharacterized protein n=1 Tax=Rhodocollybia butyracea TaxID=206335 RepID=A0A9P5P6V5_9AGAR|nr:hypothetical protein BDP27DRAFT_1431459 [Rhodocollybia butyracea]
MHVDEPRAGPSNQPSPPFNHLPSPVPQNAQHAPFFPHGNGPRTPSPVPQNEQCMPSPIPQNEQHAPSPPPGDGPHAPSPVQQNEYRAPSPQNNDNGEPPLSEVDVIRTAQEFICALREATLGDEDIASLLNPDDMPLELDPEAD